MDIIHDAPVSWPLGVRSATSFNRKVATGRKPRAKTAPIIRLSGKRRNIKKGEPLEDLSPRTNRMLQKREMVVVQRDVPVLRDVLEILTCNSAPLKQSRAHSADRVSIMQKTTQKRGVPLPAAEMALKTSRRYRHPERLKANMPVTQLRIVKSARPRKITKDEGDNPENLTECVLCQLSNTNGENNVSKSFFDGVRKCNSPGKHLSEEGEIDCSEESSKEAESQQIVNVVNDVVNDPCVSRENVPTLASGTVGAPPPPPSTPDLQKLPVTPVEKALKHNSATYSYKRHPRKSRAQSILETKRIVYETNVETLTPFPPMKTTGYNKSVQYFNEHMNIMSRNTLEQLYKES